MKDYSLGKNKEFILGYEVKDKQIIIKYAKNKTISFPYSKEKEIKILNKMKEQFLQHKYTFFNETKQELAIVSKVTAGFGSLSAVAGSLTLILSSTLFDVAAIVLSILSAGTCLWGLTCIVKCKAYLNDYEKNNLFLENKSSIEYMMEENVKTFDKALAETEEEKIYKELEQPQLTLNTVNELSLKELKGIIESIDHSKELEVEMVDAFKETLEVFQKTKKKEKVKRK